MPNDEVERRGIALTSIEAALSQSSIPSLAYRRCDPRDRSNRLLDVEVMPLNKTDFRSAPSRSPEAEIVTDCLAA
jgi:hypothetical protein